MNKIKIISAALTALTVVGIAWAVVSNSARMDTPGISPTETPVVSAPIIENGKDEVMESKPTPTPIPSPTPEESEDVTVGSPSPVPTPGYSSEPLIDAYKVFVNGQVVGVVASEDDLNAILSDMLNDYKEDQKLDNAVYEVTQTIELKKTYTFANNISHDDDIQSVISDYVVFKVEAYELSFNGCVVGYFATQQECEDILTSAKNKYTTRNMVGMKILSVEFASEFNIGAVSVLKDEVGKVSHSDAVDKLLSAEPVRKTFIATSAEELEQLYNSRKIITSRDYADQALAESGVVSLLCEERLASFAVKVETSTVDSIPYSTTTKTNGSLSYTVVRVSSEGTNGSLTQYYEELYIDGEYVSTTPTKQKKVAPKNRVVEYGTYLSFGTKVNAKTGAGMFKWPNTGVITSKYNSGHQAIDIAPVRGRDSYDIYASASGEVVEVGNLPDSSGLYVVIKHNNTYTTRYAHMSKILVVRGQYVSQGQLIGYVGATGIATGPHCHFAIIKNGRYIDPTTMLYGYASN